MARRSKPIHSEVEAFEADMIELMDSVPQTKSDVAQLENDMKALLDDAKPGRNQTKARPELPGTQAGEVAKPAKKKPKAKPKKGAKSKADTGFRELSARDPVRFRILMGLYDGVCPVCGKPVLHISAPETGIYCSEACAAAAGRQ